MRDMEFITFGWGVGKNVMSGRMPVLDILRGLCVLGWDNAIKPSTVPAPG
jgi:hypothetical protein